MTRSRQAFALVAWVAGLGAVLAGGWVLGDGALAAPDLRHPSTWADWAAVRTPAEAFMAVVRVVVVALSAYLLVVTVLAVALRLGPTGRLVTVADIVTLPFVRRFVQASLGIGLAGAAFAVVGAGQHDPTGPRTAAEVELASSRADRAAAPALQEPIHEDEVPLLQRVPDVAAPRTWVLTPGDHLWAVAERVLAEAWGRAPTDAEVDPYWRQVIETNRNRLVDPGNPDLVVPGQELVIPEPPVPFGT